MSDNNLPLLNDVSGREWRDLQARLQPIRNRLSAAQARFITPEENRHDLGHVPQLFFAIFRAAQPLWDTGHPRVAPPPSAVIFLVDRRRPRLRFLALWHRHSCLCNVCGPQGGRPPSAVSFPHKPGTRRTFTYQSSCGTGTPACADVRIAGAGVPGVRRVSSALDK